MYTYVTFDHFPLTLNVYTAESLTSLTTCLISGWILSNILYKIINSPEKKQVSEALREYIKQTKQTLGIHCMFSKTTGATV